MDDELKKTIERNAVYNTAPKCPFCGGTMLPLRYLVNDYGAKTETALLYDYAVGRLKACNRCGIVKFYPDGNEE